MSSERQLSELDLRIDELIAAHDDSRAIKDCRQYFDDPVGFMRDILHFEPWSKQIEFAESVVRNKRTVARGAHSMGKDATLGPVMLWAAYARGMLVLAISATEKQLLGQLWRELSERFLPSKLAGKLYAGDLRINGQKRIIGMTSGNVSNLSGWHDPNGVFVAISESQSEQVEAAAFDAAEANTVDDLSRICVAGNPINPAGRFYDIHQRASWAKIKMSAFDHPNIREGRMVIPGGPAPGWPKDIEQEYGADSPFYIARVLAEFPDTKIDGLIKASWWRAAVERWKDQTQWPGNALTGVPVLACDPARYGTDKSALAICQGGVCRELVTWAQKSVVESAKLVVDHATRVWAEDANRWRGRVERGQPSIYCDSPGLGGGLVDVLRVTNGPHIVSGLQPVRWHAHEFNGAAKAGDDKRFLNLRAESHFAFRKLLEDGEVAVPPDPLLQEEALAITWTLNSHNKIQIVSKDELRKDLKRSPDRWDAVLIGMVHSTGKLNRQAQLFHFMLSHGGLALSPRPF